jgi:membrane fusion protein, multidrug efflux system
MVGPRHRELVCGAPARPEGIMVELPKIQTFQSEISAAENVPSAVAVAAGPVPWRAIIKRTAWVAALLTGTAGAAYYGYDYWTNGQYQQWTDDAYVKADFTTVAPKVSGYLSEVLVEDNQKVKVGQVLARIDDRDFRTALAQARADVDTTDASISNFDAQITLQEAVIVQTKAQVAATQATLTFAKADADRYRDLSKTGAGTVQRAQQTESVRDSTQAQLARDEAAVAAAQAQIAVLKTAREQAKAQLARNKAAAAQAELNLSYTTIIAAIDGTVGARTLRVGQYVSAGTQLMAVVPLQAAYVVANFKETQLPFVRSGQPVTVTVDGIAGPALKGHVDSLSPASGLEFSLLPPDNATGNFTKIVQRIPVKIVFDDATPIGQLRTGMSVEPTIDTKAAVQDARATPREVTRLAAQTAGER